MSSADYEEYREGFEVGRDAAEEQEDESFGEVAERQLRNLLIEHPFSGKSEMWKQGFEDGKEGNWNPPDQDVEEGEGSEE